MSKPGRESLLQVLEAVQEGAALIDSRSPEWRITWANEAMCEQGDLPRSGERGARDLAHKLGGDALVQAMTAALAENATLELPVSADDHNAPLTVIGLRPILTRKGVATGEYVLTLRAASSAESAERADELAVELEQARERLEAMSADPVTGLASVVRFREQLALALASSRRAEFDLSLMAFAMDGHQAYLDTFGPHATDSCLRMLARTISRRLRRDTDFCGRISESVIAVLMHGDDVRAVEEFATRIATDVDALRIHHPRSPVGRYVTMSCVSKVVSNDDSDTAEQLINQLERAGLSDPKPAAVRLVAKND